MNLYENALLHFNAYVLSIKNNSIEVDNLIEQKVAHTKQVVVDGFKTVKKLCFSESFCDLAKISLLNHDVGRFLQASWTKTFSDFDLQKFNIKHHGELGKQILESGLLKLQIPDNRIFDETILTTVNDHVNKVIDTKQFLLLSSNLLQSEDALYFFSNASDELKKRVTNIITQIVQDVDRLDIYHQIVDGRWAPVQTDELVEDVILKQFYNGDYLNVIELRKKGLWNSNVGELVRLSFINQIRLLSVAEIIKEENLLIKMRKNQQNSQILEAYDYTIDRLNTLIKRSDGIII